MHSSTKESDLKYYERHKEKILQRQREYHQRIMANSELKLAHQEVQRKWANSHKELTSNCTRNRKQNLRTIVLTLLGNKCVRCGESDISCLCIDHVNGGGAKELRRFGNNDETRLKYIKDEILNSSKDYQILCANCNMKKWRDNKEYARHN